MINIADNFNLAGSTKPLDSRDEFNTLADMKACTVCNELHICYNKETEKQYQYSSSNTDDSTTGKWREYTPGGGGGEGTITGATIGGSPVTESGGILQFPAYPTVPITGIKDSSGNDITPVGGKVTLPAPPSVPINKIKVDGASDDLPITDGRVVIPSTPVKGIKTNGGTDLTPDSNGKVTLPPIPADQSVRIKNIENTLQQIANAEPIVIPSSAVELPTSANSTITYDSDDIYVMNISGTQIATVYYPYEHSTNSYLAFKAIDRDLYYVYQLTNAANNTYTFVEQHTYDELSHSEAKAVFEAGKYAVKQVIDVRHTGNPLPEGYFKHGIPSVFVTPDGYPLRYNQIKENNVWYILLKCDENNKIFKYSAFNNKWSLVSGGCYTKNDATTGENYEKYDAYFDRQPASNVSFDDSITQLGTSQDPVDNVQKAINVLTTAVVSGNCILSVNLKDFDGTDIASEYIGLSYVLNGNTVVLSDLSDTTPAISTDSNGIAHAVIPYGAQYTIVFNTRSNRQAIPAYTNIADINHINLFRYYNKEADKELVIIQVMVKNANNADLDNYSLQNKEVYIDYLNNQGTVITEAAITCYLNVRGRIETWKESGSDTVYNYSEDPIYINKGQYYRVRLQEWSPSLPSDEQELVKSENKSRLAQDYTKSFQMFYTYKKAGIFLVIEDYNDDTDLNTYTEYLCESYDDTDHTITIIDNETDNRYILKYDASEGGIVRALSTDPTNFILWISTSNLSKVLGVGVRTSDTINSNLEYSAYESYGYVDCSFLIPRNVATVTKKMQDTVTTWSSLPVSNSGKSVTMFMAESQVPYCEMADYVTNNLSLKTGSLTQKAFIPSPLQARVMANNKVFIKNVLLVLNNTLFNNVLYTITVREASSVSFQFINIYGTSGTPLTKTNNQNVVPIYCF